MFKTDSTKIDPGFLVAKGRFKAPEEDELQELLRSGVSTQDERIPSMKEKIDQSRRRLEKKHVKDLGNAIFMAIRKNGYANVRAIGRNANYNAAKAISIASGHCASKGIILRFGLTFDEGNLGSLRSSRHVSNVVALLYTLEGFKKRDYNLDGEDYE